MANGTSSDNPPAPAAPSGAIVGDSIPMPMVAGLIIGILFGIFLLGLHICLVRFLVKARAKHIPKLRTVKVKKGKKGKKGKKNSKSETSSTKSTSTTSSIAM